MAYQKIGFKNGNVLTAEQLIHMEDGIINAEKKAGAGTPGAGTPGGTGTGLPSDVGAYKYMATDGEGNWVAEDRLAYRLADTYTDMGSDSFEVTEDNKITWGDNDEYFGYGTWESANNTAYDIMGQFEAGKFYRVTYNGVDYVCECKNTVYDGEVTSTKYLGNIWLGYGDNGGERTNEPFLFVDWDGWCWYWQETGTHELSFALATPNYKPVPEYFLPDAALRPDYDNFDAVSAGYIKNRPCYYSGVRIKETGVNYRIGKVGDGGYLAHTPMDYDFIPGYLYRVVGTFTVNGNYGSTTFNVDFITEAVASGVYFNAGGLNFVQEYVLPNPPYTPDHTIRFDGIVNASAIYESWAGRLQMTYGTADYSSTELYVTDIDLHCYTVKQLDPVMLPFPEPIIFRYDGTEYSCSVNYATFRELMAKGAAMMYVSTASGAEIMTSRVSARYDADMNAVVIYAYDGYSGGDVAKLVFSDGIIEPKET